MPLTFRQHGRRVHGGVNKGAVRGHRLPAFPGGYAAHSIVSVSPEREDAARLQGWMAAMRPSILGIGAALRYP